MRVLVRVDTTHSIQLNILFYSKFFYFGFRSSFTVRATKVHITVIVCSGGRVFVCLCVENISVGRWFSVRDSVYIVAANPAATVCCLFWCHAEIQFSQAIAATQTCFFLVRYLQMNARSSHHIRLSSSYIELFLLSSVGRVQKNTYYLHRSKSNQFSVRELFFCDIFHVFIGLQAIKLTLFFFSAKCKIICCENVAWLCFILFIRVVFLLVQRPATTVDFYLVGKTTITNRFNINHLRSELVHT